jgi:hypothetical protein
MLRSSGVALLSDEPEEHSFSIEPPLALAKY